MGLQRREEGCLKIAQCAWELQVLPVMCVSCHVHTPSIVHVSCRGLQSSRAAHFAGMMCGHISRTGPCQWELSVGESAMVEGSHAHFLRLCRQCLASRPHLACQLSKAEFAMLE